MRTFTETELKSILEEHKVWYTTNGKQGKRANLSGAYLYDADLRGASLIGADLECALLLGADVTGTILEEKKQEKVSEETVSAPINLRAKFDEFAKSLGLEIISLKVKRSETSDL